MSAEASPILLIFHAINDIWLDWLDLTLSFYVTWLSYFTIYIKNYAKMDIWSAVDIWAVVLVLELMQVKASTEAEESSSTSGTLPQKLDMYTLKQVSERKNGSFCQHWAGNAL